MSILQHELQHVLEFATGRLSLLGYAVLPFNWTYRYQLGPTTSWERLGAEQRAQIVQDYWLTQRRPEGDGAELAQMRDLIPWAV